MIKALLGVAFALGMSGTASAQTLNMMKGIDAPHYDAQRTSWGPTSDIVNMIQDTLVALDWDGRTPIPYLAKSWTVSPDGKLYTFKLRDDVTFCSGKKMTAEDVIFTFKRLKSPEIKGPFAWRAGNIKDLRAPDPYTVEYELAEPFSELLLQLTMFTNAILNKDNVEALGKDYGVKGADGTGPWCLESWQPRTNITLKRHDAYRWGPSMYKNKGPVKFEKMVIKIVPEDSSRVAAMMAGQFDTTHQFPSQFIAQAKVAPTLTVTEAKPNFQLLYFGFKTTRPMVADKRVREAMSIAIDRAAIAKAILLGNADPAFTIVDAAALDHDPKTAGIVKQDVERAKTLLDEAGWKPGADGIREKDGVKLAPKVYYTANANSARVAEAIQGYLRKIGVHWNLQPWDLDHRVGEDGRAGLRNLVGHRALSLGRRPDEHLFRLRQHPDAQPHELEGRRDRRLAEARPRRADARGTEQVLRPGAAKSDERASLDARAQHQHARDHEQEAEGHAPAHDLPEHFLQGAGCQLLTSKLHRWGCATPATSGAPPAKEGEGNSDA